MQQKFYKYTCRDRTMHDTDIRKLFQLCPYASPLPDSATLFESFPSQHIITTSTTTTPAPTPTTTSTSNNNNDSVAESNKPMLHTESK